MAQQPVQAEESREEMDSFERLQFEADMDLFFDNYLAAVERGDVSYDQADAFFKRLGCE
jgi:hypothetical protein